MEHSLERSFSRPFLIAEGPGDPAGASCSPGEGGAGRGEVGVTDARRSTEPLRAVGGGTPTTRLHVLQVNNWHQVRGGSDAVYLSTGAMLEAAGHSVSWFSVDDPDNVECRDAAHFVEALPLRPGEGVWRSARATGRMVHSFEVPRRIVRLATERGIDVAHGHCIYHRIGASFIPALRHVGVPTVLSLHDYKIVCPTYRMLRDGRVCEECMARPFSVVRHRCARGSRAQSLLYWVEAAWNRVLGRYSRSVAAFAAVSRFARDLHVRAGIPAERIHYLPNWVDLPPPSDPAAREEHLLYAGRLSQEKGLEVLLEAVRGTSLRLRIAGDGPLRPVVEQAARAGFVEYVGRLDGDVLRDEYSRCRAVVVPSIWYENASITVLEALASGAPVVASDIGGLPEQVRSGVTGWVCPAGDSQALRRALLQAADEPAACAEMGAAGREFVAESHCAERHLAALLEIYAAALADLER